MTTGLISGMRGAAVNDLHRLLQTAGYAVTDTKETASQLFGPATLAALHAFQKQRGLPTTNGLDNETLTALQQSTPASSSGLPKPAAPGLSGQPLTTGKRGAASGPAAIDKPGTPHPPSGLGDGEGLVHGRFVDQDGAPLAQRRIALASVFIRGEAALGEGETDAAGQYLIRYRRAVTQNLLVRAYDASGKVSASSPTHFAAPAIIEVDLTSAPDGIVRPPSVFTRLNAQIATQLRDTPLQSLKENSDSHDIQFLAQAAGLRFHTTSSLYIASSLAHDNGLMPETIYGILRQGIPSSLNAALTRLPEAGMDATFMSQVLTAILSHSRNSLSRALSASLHSNAIPQSYTSSLNAELDALDRLRVQRVMDLPYLAGKTALKDLLAKGNVSAQVQAAFGKAYTEAEGRWRVTWQTLSSNPQFPEQELATLRTTLRLGSLLRGNLTVFGDALARVQQPGSSIRDLARMDQSDWVARITEIDPQANSIPAVVPNETPQQRIQRYASRISANFANRYPTAAFAGGLAKAQNSLFQEKEALLGFFNAQPKFSLGASNIDQFIAKNQVQLAPAAVNELKTAQRLFRVSRNFSRVSALKSAGYRSAQEIYFKGRTPFLDHMTEALGGASAAQKTFAKAQLTYATSLMAFGRYNAALNGVTVAAQQSPAPQPDALAGLPGLQALFGSLDTFQCTDCQSVYSPAAYFVDLMQYLQQFTATGDGVSNAGEAILKRRADLQYIALNCNNTNVTLPYIDVVNEILEAAIAPPAQAVTYIDTLGTPEERRALPQQILLAAYDKTKTASFPMGLPFDLQFAQTRAYIAGLGTGWATLAKAFTFSTTPPAKTSPEVACLQLNLNPATRSIVANVNNTDPWKRWGLPQKPAPVADPKSPANSYNPNPGDWTGALGKVPVLLQRSGLSLRQLYQLLEVTWVTQSAVTLKLGSLTQNGVAIVDPDTDAMTFTGLTADVLDRANRFIRLWRTSQLTMWELDWALEHPTGGAATLDDFLVFLADALAVQGQLQLPFQELLSFWMAMETRDVTNHLHAEDQLIPSTYSEVFRNPAVLATWSDIFVTANNLSNAKIIDPNSLTPTREQSAVAAALGLTAQDISAVLNFAAATKGVTFDALNKLTLDSLNTLFCYQRLAGALSLATSDLLLWIQLTGANPFAGTPGDTLEFLRRLAVLRGTGAAAVDLDYLLRHQSATQSSLAITEQQTTATLQAIHDALAKMPAPGGMAIAAVSNATPIQVSTGAAHGLQTGTQVTISGVHGTTAANGSFLINVTGPLSFTLNGSAGNGDWTGGGTIVVSADVIGASNTTPITIKTAAPHGLVTGTPVVVSGVLGNSAANGSFTVTVTGADTFTLDKSAGNGNWSHGGQIMASTYDVAAIQTVCVSALAATTGVTSNVVAPALQATALLPLSAATISTLLNGAATVDPTQFPTLINAITAVSKAAALYSTVALNENEFPFLVNNAGLFNWLNPASLPLAPNLTSPYLTFEALLQAVSLNRRQTARTPKLFEVLAQWLTAMPGDLGTAITGKTLNVAGASQTTPITITTTAPHGLRTGMQVNISGVLGNTAANGDFTVGVTSATAFTLNGSAGNAAWTGGGSVVAVSTSLARALRATPNDLTAIATALRASPPSLNNATRPGSLADVGMLTAIANALDISGRYRVSAATLVQLAQVTPTVTQVAAAQSALQARYPQAAWLKAIQPIEDKLREHRRDALVAYLLGSWATQNYTYMPAAAPALKTTNDIYDTYLIDPEMSACATTTRLLEASLAIQQYVQQCFLNLPGAVTVNMNNSLADEWDWRRQFRLWQANREVFLYPENYLLPEIRRNASPFFSELMSDLRQSDCDANSTEAALQAYLRKLVEVARLVIAAHYNQLNADGSTQLHVFAHTRTTPPKWYYRTWDSFQGQASGTWSAWTPLQLDLSPHHLVPVIWDRHLHLVWPVFKPLSEQQGDQPVPSSSGGGSEPPPKKFWAVEFAMSELSAGQWQPKRTISDKMYFEVGATATTPMAFMFQAVQDSSFNLQISVYCNNQVQESISFLIATGTLSMPDSPLTPITQYQGLVPDPGSVDLSQEPSLVFVNSINSWSGQNNQYPALPQSAAFWGQVLVYADSDGDVLPNPGSVSGLYVLANGQGGSGNIELLGNITNPRTVVPQQEGNFDSADPFFIADPTRTYFVIPQYTTLSSQPLATQPSSGQWNTNYIFQSFYHPYARTLLRELETQGVKALLARDLQLDPEKVRNWNVPRFDFNALYSPTNNVLRPLPGEPNAPDPGENGLDFDPACGGAYSLYNWETFYHVPILVATLLLQNQRYSDALKWLEYVFNPTDSSGEPAPQRFWQFAPFYELNQQQWSDQQIQNLLSTLAAAKQQGINDDSTANAINNWINHPFDPHAVASLRIAAYAKAAVMKFLDILIAWGDWYYSQYTAETVSQAEQLYVFANMVLGPKPELVRAPQAGGAQSPTYASLKNVDLFANTLVEVENVVIAPDPPETLYQGAGDGDTLPQFPGNGSTLLFCIPPNEQLLGYWGKVEQRLYNIRHCLNMQGVPQPLPLYAPPINPLAVAEQQTGGVGSTGVNAPSPVYRFTPTLQKALALANDVRAFGALILGALEKQDAESLAELNASQALDIQTRMLDVKQGQVDDAQDQIAALQKQKAVVQLRYNFYSNIAFLNPWETAALSLQAAGLVASGAAVVLDMVAGIAHLIPSLEGGVSGFGGTPAVNAKYGGVNVGNSSTSWADVARGLAGVLNASGGLASTMGGYQRRMDEWKLQANTAQAELDQLDAQITAANDRLAIAKSQYNIQTQQIANAQALSDFLNNKYTNAELYNWMLTQLSTVYAQAYQLAFSLGQQAQSAYQYELGTQDTFLQYGYWDSQHKGLTAGESLLFDLRRMEAQYLSANSRELEILKHFSLALLDPTQLIMLRETGTCQIALNEDLFDRDHPGQYFRRLRNVALTVPCVTGPYSGVNATLTLTGALIRTQPPGNAYTPQAATAAPNDPNAILASPLGAPGTTTIAISSGRNDSGLFEPNLRDERWLPFEGQGAISTWNLVLDPRDNQFDCSTISDVILHVRYTARGGADPSAANVVRSAVLNRLKDNKNPQALLVSVKSTFNDSYYRFFNPSDPNATQQVLSLPVAATLFPLANFAGATPKVVNIASYVLLTKTIPDALPTTIWPASANQPGPPANLTFNPLNDSNGNPLNALSADAGGNGLLGGSAPQALNLAVQSGDIPASLKRAGAGPARLDPALIQDIFLVVQYTY